MLHAAMLTILTGILVLPFDAALAQTTGAPERMQLAQAQTGQSVRKARPQVRISPRYLYRNYHTTYPVPYKYEYPGPNGVRRCVNRYVTEHRPSGNVLVPRMRCWWEARR